MTRYTASGIFSRIFQNKINAVFIVDDIQFTYRATVSVSPSKGAMMQPLQPFTLGNATLHYNTENELTSMRSCRGKIGTDAFRLELDNGVVIDGKIDGADSTPGVMVKGSGSWKEY